MKYAGKLMSLFALPLLIATGNAFAAQSDDINTPASTSEKALWNHCYAYGDFHAASVRAASLLKQCRTDKVGSTFNLKKGEDTVIVNLGSKVADTKSSIALLTDIADKAMKQNATTVIILPEQAHEIKAALSAKENVGFLDSTYHVIE
ncbi:hypothetical protein NLY09_09250 (plasmid) [Burkholderia vietnamiensis]